MNNTAITLLTEAEATGDYVRWPGGRGEFRVGAQTWNAATATLQVEGPRQVAQAVGSDTTLTADGGAIFELGAGARIRVLITGSPTNVTALAIPIPR